MENKGPEFRLRPLAVPDADALQAVYDRAPAAFKSLQGRPALPGQARAELERLAQTEGRFQFGMLLDETMIGVIDCKLSDEEDGLAFIGQLLMAEPFADESIAALALRMLERWLSRSYNVRRLETSVPAHDRTALRFWSDQGFSFTGEQHRRELATRSPRFLQMARDVLEFAK